MRNLARRVISDRTALVCLILAVMIGPSVIAKVRDISLDLGLFYQRQITDPQRIRQYFDEHAIRKLHLGAGGNNVDGWLNSDIVPEGNAIYLDATTTYPFANGSFHYILAEHLIEHLTWENGMKMLEECYRVLAPGGKLRIVTPNLVRHIYSLENERDPEVQKFLKANRRLFGWPDTPVAAAYDFNKSIRDWGHVFIYDPRTLKKTLELAGFKIVKELSVRDKTDPVFENAEFRKREKHGQFGEDVVFSNGFVSMAFEAVR